MNKATYISYQFTQGFLSVKIAISWWEEKIIIHDRQVQNYPCPPEYILDPLLWIKVVSSRPPNHIAGGFFFSSRDTFDCVLDINQRREEKESQLALVTIVFATKASWFEAQGHKIKHQLVTSL